MSYLSLLLDLEYRDDSEILYRCNWHIAVFTAHHCQLMETLMALKPDIAKDLLSVIAHGTLKARVAGAHLLFYYWPALNPTLYDRRGLNTKFNGKISLGLSNTSLIWL